MQALKEGCSMRRALVACLLTVSAAQGALDLGLSNDPNWTGGLGALLRFQAPADTSIAAVSINRSTSGAPTGVSFLTYQINVDGTLLDGCLPSAGCSGDVSGTVTKDGLQAATLDLTAGCGGTIP